MSEPISKIMTPKILPKCDYCLISESSRVYSCKHSFCSSCQDLLNSESIFFCPFEECVRALNICPIHNSEYENACANDYTPLCEYCYESHSDHAIKDLNSVSSFYKNSKKVIEKYRPTAELIVEHEKLYTEIINLLHALDEKVANIFRISFIGLQMHEKINEIKVFEGAKKDKFRNIECYEIFSLSTKMKIALAKYLKDPEDFQHNLYEADKGLERNMEILQTICGDLEDLTN